MSTPHDSFDPSLEPLGLPSGGADSASVFEHLVDGVHHAGERLKDELGALAQTLDEASQECVACARDYADSARESVRERPIRAVAAAFVVGMLLGRIIR